jgi:hypothetical protein
MRDSDPTTDPLARKNGLVVEEVGGEVLVYDLERHHAHCLNSTAAFVWRQCDGRTRVTQIADLLAKQQGKAIDVGIVWLALNQLVKANLLVQNLEVEERVRVKSVSRRQMMRTIGVGAVVALPLITSLVAPIPAQAATCTLSGQPCGTSAQCCSGICQGNVCL